MKMQLCLKLIGFYIAVFLISLPVQAKQQVYFAGSGYLGRYDDIGKNYPHAVRINNAQKPVATLTKAFAELIQRNEFKNFEVNFKSVDQNLTRPLMMALSIERENLAFSTLNTPIAEISAQLVFFDYNTRTLVAAKQIPIAVNGVKNNDGTVDQDALFDLAYLSEEGLLSEALKSLKATKLKEFQKVRLQATKVTIAKKLLQKLPKELTERGLTQFLGQRLSAKLSQQRFNVIPYQRGATIGRQMAFRLADSSGFNLQLPEADYEIHMTFLDALSMQQPTFSLHGVDVEFSIKQKSSNTVRFQSVLTYAVSTKKVANVDAKDSWAPYEDAIENLLAELAQQLVNPNKAWFKEHAFSQSAFKQAKALSKSLG